MLQRYLTLIKQGQLEEPWLTVTLQRDHLKDDPVLESGTREDDSIQKPQDELDETANEVVKALPEKERKNAEYILKKPSRSNSGWTSRGEFVYQGHVTKGSHLVDLLKALLLQIKRKHRGPPPSGWTSGSTHSE